MTKRKTHVKKIRQNRPGIILVFLVVVVLMLVVVVNNHNLKKKLEVYKEKEQMLTEQIEEEKERTKEIEEYTKYTKTKKYIEEIAREKLGLVYEDEIIIQTDED